ncbi:MAG TPA: choice-of-anchor tandem repeat GloVer-containing protein [Candidatus Dormibacteraeota bacterium]|jgi:uncharacterized repeat protein (TIGR03803 family)|nr:choice-of-anchor tandem repeat GloVer-containing protein [Candidatus Dormibacteraeota bacterium]
MKNKTVLVLVIVTLVLVVGAWAGTEKVLYAFTGGTDGGRSEGGVIVDKAGNLYGTTNSGGMYNAGTVFELSPSNGSWNETVLYSFTGGSDGAYPMAGLTFCNGNLYGTTMEGGGGWGVVFELAALANGWKQSVIYNFSAPGDGEEPFGGLTCDAAGALYGTTYAGGIYGGGTVFKLTQMASSSKKRTWSEAMLHSFGNTNDGMNPQGTVVLDKQGNVYGTTTDGGSGRGTVFELTRSASGWSEAIIYNFSGGNDGAFPYAGVVFDSAGNLYGTTYVGGTYGEGTVFRLTLSNSQWTEAVLYAFDAPNGGGYPHRGSLTLDVSGKLHGTTSTGDSAGTVFDLNPSNGSWTESVQYAFSNEDDGGTPYDGLILDAAGNLYGTTVGGGKCNQGVVFEVTP